MVILVIFIKIMIITMIRAAANMKFTEIEPEKPDPKPTQTRKAVLWGQEDLLSRAVSLLLESGMTWEVLRVQGDGNVERLIQKIKKVNPDVVILCQERANGDSILPLRVINEQLCPKVVTLNLENNLMQVYSRQNIIIQGVTDLLSIIDPEYRSNCTPGREVGSKQHIS